VLVAFCALLVKHSSPNAFFVLKGLFIEGYDQARNTICVKNSISRFFVLIVVVIAELASITRVGFHAILKCFQIRFYMAK
jgi:hypothetical protein